MKIVFISYADENMAYSLKRIGKQAKKIKIFDEIILWTPKMLPKYVLNSPLMKYTRGGGYWAWKPIIIWETLQQFNEGTVVVYCDAGCTLNKSSEWRLYFEKLKRYSALCFEYKNNMDVWDKFGQTSTKIKYWTKDKTLNYFNKLLGDPQYGDKYNKIWGGLILCRGKENLFINHWLKLTIENPELIIDPELDMDQFENKLLAYHKHDQSIITPLAHLYNSSVAILPETAETGTNSPVIASRFRAKSYKEAFILNFKSTIRNMFGGSFVENLKSFKKTTQ